MDGFNTVIRFFQEGGAFMYPILLVLLLGLAIAAERFIYLNKARAANRQAWDELFPLLQKGNFKDAERLTSQSDAAVSKTIGYGLSRLRTAPHREDIEIAMEEGLMEMVPRIEKRTHYLATFANIATLLGLLGTIIGLIQAFSAVASADPAQKADLLSSSISVAMNTTAFGLIVAIPLLLIYTVLQTKTTELVDGLEMTSVKFLNMIGDMNGSK